MWDKFKHNILHLLISVDQVLNVIRGMFVGEKAYADETLSSRAYRYHVDGIRDWPMKIIDTIFFFDKQEITNEDGSVVICRHCHLSFLSERSQRHLPPEARCDSNQEEC